MGCYFHASPLDKFEAGDLSAWWTLHREMTLKPSSTRYVDIDERKLDLTQSQGWIDAELATRSRIMVGAKEYLIGQDEITYDWVSTNSYNRAALAGCKAFLLLLINANDYFNAFSPRIWKKWAPAIIAAPSHDQHENSYLELVHHAYSKAPEESIATLITLIDRENQEYDCLYAISKFSQCWDERLKFALLEKAKDPKLKPKCFGQLIEQLLLHGSTKARDFAKSLLILPLPSVRIKRDKVLNSAKVLVEDSNSSTWDFIWPLIQNDSSFGCEVLELVAVDFSKRTRLNIPETQLADLYIWLVNQYPYEEDPDHNDEDSNHNDELSDYVLTARDGIIDLRNDLLSQLKKRGNLQACKAIRHIIKELPNVALLKKVLIDAQEYLRRSTWKPPTPEEFLQLTFDQDRRLIQSGQHLLEVLIESLHRLEMELQGETPAVRDLWDKKTGSSFRPLDENAFSDYVKRFLDRDLKSQGIIVNREVELRRSYGGNPGERTDIQVDAISKRSNGEILDVITVIIEVKGCWHNELQSAMQTQLVERYLADNSCPYGLYLVGWFNCQQWDDGDSRKANVPKLTLDELDALLKAQSERLSSETIAVSSYALNAALR